MSSGSPENHEELLADFVREVRQLNGLSASFFRAAAAQARINVTDLQVIDILDITGPATAGQLAELMGLTTGAITGMIDRLEEAGLVRRERDPEDGRRVIVRLTPDEEALGQIGPIFDSIDRGWDRIAAGYDDEQLAALLEFLRRSTAMVRDEIARLRETPSGSENTIAVPLGGQAKGRLVVSAGMTTFSVRAERGLPDLFRAEFTGSLPAVKVEGGTVHLRYPNRLWFAGKRPRSAEVVLCAGIPWQVDIRGSGADLTAALREIDLLGLEAGGDGSAFRLDLPEPSGDVSVRISGSGTEFTIRRPAGVPVRVHWKGWGSEATLDERPCVPGAEMRIQSPDFDGAPRRYDLEGSGSGSKIAITTW